MLINLFRHSAQWTDIANSFLPPIFLLARDVGRADNWFVRIDEEKCEDLAVAWFAGVLEMEGLDAVLEDLELC